MDAGTKYARNVVDGNIVACKKVIQACERHLKDLEKDFDYIYLPERAEKAIKFMELLPDISTGKPAKMAEFQKFIIYSLYGWYRKDNTDLRRFNKAMVSMARKMGNHILLVDWRYMNFLRVSIQNKTAKFIVLLNQGNRLQSFLIWLSSG